MSKNKLQKKRLNFKDHLGSPILSLIRVTQLGATNFWRNKFLSLATIVVMAVIIFIFNIILAVQHIGNQALQSLSQRVDIVIYLRNDIDFYNANRISEILQRIDGVKSVKYTSREEALQIISQTHPKTAEFLQRFNLQNPLPPSLSITTQNPEDYRKVEMALENSEFTQYLENYVTQGSTGESMILSNVARNMENISQFVRQIIFWMIFVFVLGGTLIMVNAIQLTIFSRRQEIHIMRLVGATPNFIRLPFIIEGIIYGLLAVALSFTILLILAQSIHLDNTNLWEYYETLNIGRVFWLEIFITMILTAISSFATTEQYLKSKLLLEQQ